MMRYHIYRMREIINIKWKVDIYIMFFWIGVSIILLISLVLILLAFNEFICSYRNPFPLFDNSDKRFSEIFLNKEKNYKTRSILKDIKYDL